MSRGTLSPDSCSGALGRAPGVNVLQGLNLYSDYLLQQLHLAFGNQSGVGFYVFERNLM